MKNILTMTMYTLREARAKKVFVFYLGFSVIILLVLGAVLGLSEPDKILPVAGSDIGKVRKIISGFEIMVAGSLGTLLIFLAVFSTANFISSMLEKGTADLFLSKPVSRGQLLWGKFIGGCIVFIINILLPVVGSWLIISMKFGYYNFNFLWIIIAYTFSFAVLYSIVIFFGVLTRSSFPGIMTSYFIFIFLSQLLLLGKQNAEKITSSSILQGVIKGFYYIVPKTGEILGNISKNLVFGEKIEDFQPVITTFLFLILMMFSAIFFFRRKDF